MLKRTYDWQFGFDEILDCIFHIWHYLQDFLGMSPHELENSHTEQLSYSFQIGISALLS